MRDAAFLNRLALRIDVDFGAGMDRAVPFFLDTLERAGTRATFFIVAGCNSHGRLLRRLADPRYVRRLWKLGPRRIARGTGLRDSGGPLDSESRRRLVARIVDAGHEVAVHGWDHGWWADNVWTAEPGRLSNEIDRAFEALEGASGHDDLAWGSPNWRTTPRVLELLHRRGVPYFAECWGRGPFRSADTDGQAIPRIHLPVTITSLESLVLEQARDAEGAVAAAFDGRPPDRYDMVCVHDYFEGLMHPRAFVELIRVCTERGWRTVTLRETAAAIEAACLRLPVHGLSRGPLPGFAGSVNWQQDSPGDPAP